MSLLMKIDDLLSLTFPNACSSRTAFVVSWHNVTAIGIEEATLSYLEKTISLSRTSIRYGEKTQHVLCWDLIQEDLKFRENLSNVKEEDLSSFLSQFQKDRSNGILGRYSLIPF